MRKEFNYIYSFELDVPLRIRLISLFELIPNARAFVNQPSGCMLFRVMVFCNGRYVGRDVQTSFRWSTTNAGERSQLNKHELESWSEWLTLPICYSELNRDAILHISIWDINNDISPAIIAQCSKSLFSKHGVYRSGQINLRMRRVSKPLTTAADVALKELEACAKIVGQSALIHPHLSQHPQFVLEKRIAMAIADLATNAADRATAKKPPASADLRLLFKRIKLYGQDLIDRVRSSRLEEIKQEAKKEDLSLYLTIQLPNVHYLNDIVAYTIIFYAEDEEMDSLCCGTPDYMLNAAGPTTKINVYTYGVGEAESGDASAGSVALPTSSSRDVDPKLGQDNLCELRHCVLARNARTNNVDRRLRPNSSTRDAIQRIINAPSFQCMTIKERDVIWKFRFWLKSNPKALVKFIRSVNWEEDAEVKHAIQVILKWEPIDACDAVELLTPTFTHPFVRRYAVSRLQRTTYAQILIFLPQLVQALRYETKVSAHEILFVSSDISRTHTNTSLRTSSDGPPMSAQTPKPNVDDEATNLSTLMAEYFGSDADLASFLIREACENTTIANFLYWYLKVEIEANAEIDEAVKQIFSTMMERLKTALANGNLNARQTLVMLNQQKKFVDTLVGMAKFVAKVSGSRSKKLEMLKRKLVDNSDLADLRGLSLPLDPSIRVKNIQAESTLLFSSKMMPMRLTFATVRDTIAHDECGEMYTIIFKRGDDLRQDQLVVQMIRLMDGLLKAERLDLCLTPYAVLATSVSEGFIQFVNATPIANLNSIQETLRTFRPSFTGPYGIEVDALNNYVRSCAGYSVICYILGVGDRHLHNLLLCENGRMFHVDFGFILGQDPKPMPPPMKLTSEMVNAMGGQNSEYFKNFLDYITKAFCILRRNVNLIINLFSLMLDAGIPDIAIEKEKAVQRLLERFHLQLSDECARQLMRRLVETSLSAKMPILVDFVHDVKQFISD